jgi:hypothetical protein
MAEGTGTATIDDTLRDIARGRCGQELVFDPRTGRLIVTDEPRPEHVVATDAAAGGYF